MKKKIMNLVSQSLLVIVLFAASSGLAYSLQLPETDLAGLKAVTETVQTALASLQQGVIILVVLLALSIGFNFLMMFYIWRLNEQLNNALATKASLDEFKEKVYNMLLQSHSIGALDAGTGEIKTSGTQLKDLALEQELIKDFGDIEEEESVVIVKRGL
ncbi:MAG: hypothetical protein M1269_02330 [Chloroflexi bacterium]|nr:hypothetical protein [Chloroflexota bacterium]